MFHYIQGSLDDALTKRLAEVSHTSITEDPSEDKDELLNDFNQAHLRQTGQEPQCDKQPVTNQQRTSMAFLAVPRIVSYADNLCSDGAVTEESQREGLTGNFEVMGVDQTNVQQPYQVEHVSAQVGPGE